jgi:hypothetical protein
MSALEASIENLTAEHTALTQKLEQIDQQYRVERPVIVSQISQLARALSALTGKAIAGPSDQTDHKPMSEECKTAIKAGLEKARAAKQAGSANVSGSTQAQKPAEMISVQAKPQAPSASQTLPTHNQPKNVPPNEKAPSSR